MVNWLNSFAKSKIDFLREHFVFSIWLFNKLVYQHIFQTTHKTLKTKHQTRDEFVSYEFIIP